MFSKVPEVCGINYFEDYFLDSLVDELDIFKLIKVRQITLNIAYFSKVDNNL